MQDAQWQGVCGCFTKSYVARRRPKDCGFLHAGALERFAHDDAVTVRSVLRDLVDSAMLYRTGRGSSTRYQVSGAWDDDGSADAAQRLCHLVCMTVHRLAPASGDDVSQALSLSAEHLTPALDSLVSEGRIRRTQGADGRARYDGNGCVLPLGDSKGWEAAVFDHYQAMVSTLCAKLQQGRLSAGADDLLGGSTFGLRVWRQHPHYEEATTFLQRFRAESAQLRAKVAAYNQSHPIPAETTRVVIYGGQLLNDERRENDSHEVE